MWYRYMNFNWGNGMPFGFWGILAPLMILDLVLRGIALWRSGRAGQRYWFVALLLINSVGILPGIYLLIHHQNTPAKSKR